jgi:hypothetical protein
MHDAIPTLIKCIDNEITMEEFKQHAAQAAAGLREEFVRPALASFLAEIKKNEEQSPLQSNPKMIAGSSLLEWDLFIGGLAITVLGISAYLGFSAPILLALTHAWQFLGHSFAGVGGPSLLTRERAFHFWQPCFHLKE